MTVRRWVTGRSVALVAALLLMPQAKAAAQRIDWEALNPAYKGATFVKDAGECRACHKEPMQTFEHTLHARAFQNGKMPEQGLCESCHGPASKHNEEPGPELKWANLTSGQQAQVCQQCHQGGARMSFKAGAHLSSDVSCTSCHKVMEARSERVLLARAREPETCYSCHSATRAQMSKSSHHPVREGRLECSSCHNPHSSTPALLRTATISETCVSCHTEKRGPYVWEHAPVRESCTNCHDPHGSTNRNMLTRKDSFLCLQCHSYGGHINLPRYNRTSNPYGTGCVNCHTAVHGSNHPSGAKLTR